MPRLCVAAGRLADMAAEGGVADALATSAMSIACRRSIERHDIDSVGFGQTSLRGVRMAVSLRRGKTWRNQ
jgi:hypothetical protein